jgi:hypothetical protein
MGRAGRAGGIVAGVLYRSESDISHVVESDLKA